MTKIAAFSITILICGCTSSPHLFQVHYDFSDLVDQRKIEVSYTNNLRRTVCLLPEDWPNQAGKINQASQDVFLVVDDQRLPLKDFNTGYCPDCPIRVAPGETTRAFIGYTDFAVPEALVDQKKELIFHPKGYTCSRRDHPWWK